MHQTTVRRGGIYPARETPPRREPARAGIARPYGLNNFTQPPPAALINESLARAGKKEYNTLIQM